CPHGNEDLLPMEIKVVCACGTKFKFDVEPVNGRMPAPIHCPTCGADDTAQANDLIRDQLSATAAPASLIPQPPAGSGALRIARAAGSGPQASAEPARESGITPQPPNSPTPQLVASVPRRVMAPPQRENPWKRGIILVLCLAVAGFGVWRVGSKWYKRIKL